MKTDARIRYTKLRIKEAFMETITRKPLNKVTVKEICDRAEINRATFYTHYRDPYDLLEQLENDTANGLREMIQGGIDEGRSLLCKLLIALDEENQTYTLFSSPDVDPGFSAKISSLFYDLLIVDVAKRLPESDPYIQDQVYHFLAGGCGNLIAKWLKSGKPLKGEEMARALEEMCNVFVCAYGEQLARQKSRRM